MKWHYTVHCRTGSLENEKQERDIKRVVHCRTGSLEKLLWPVNGQMVVHCRTGSLETGQKSG